MKNIIKIAKKNIIISITVIAIAIVVLGWVFLMNCCSSGPWPEITPQERAYYEKGIEEYKNKQQRLKGIQ